MSRGQLPVVRDPVREWNIVLLRMDLYSDFHNEIGELQ
jgi:hypothetical protein